MFLLMLLSACAPKTASVTPSAAPANAAHVSLMLADLAPSGPEDAPNTRLSLTWVDATGATLGTASIAETIGGCSTREPTDGALFEVGCWWAGGGPEYRGVVRDGAVVVQTRDVDEGLRKPTAWRDLSESTLGAGQSVSYLPAPPPVDYVALTAAADRTDADRALDAGRHPAEVLGFFGIASGQHVAELGAGGGYTAELLARAVAPGGVVYGQNTPEILSLFAAKPWAERLARPACANITAVESPFDAPFPASVHDLDAVLITFLYHDTAYMGVDRAKMNAAVFAALAPGGVYGVLDHSAIAGHGADDAKTLHRIDEELVKKEVLAAGFVLDAEADFLRNPSDARDWSASPMSAGEKRGTSDRFVLRFQKPSSTGATAHLLPPVTMNEGDRPTDCNLQDPGSWDPLLAASQPGGTAPVVVRGKNGIAETVVLDDGTEIRVVRGGCEHVGETWSIAPVPAKPQIAAMRQVIGKLTLNPAASPSLVKCLDDAHEAEEVGFGCGEAYVSRSVQGDVLEFTWSFAL